MFFDLLEMKASKDILLMFDNTKTGYGGWRSGKIQQVVMNL
jgi:hypothetical protein